MKVYVVTEGSYSDFHVSAIFSSREKAVEYMGGFPDQFNGIEEYELDAEPPRVMSRCWHAHLRLDGSLYMPQSDGVEDVEEECRHGERGRGWTTVQNYYPKTLNWFNGKSYVSAEHAMKLAVEQRQKALREHPEFFTESSPCT
jgi:hypothetical protein